MRDVFEIDAARSTAVVTLTGELDAHDAPRLRDAFSKTLSALTELGARPILVLDLSAVDFLDSTALGTMVGALRRVRDADGEMRVVLPETTARRIFEITGLDEVLNVFPTRDAALAG